MKQPVIVRIALGVFGLLTVAMLLLAVFNDKGLIEVRAQAKKLSTIESEISKLDTANKQFSSDIQGLQENVEFAEITTHGYRESLPHGKS